MSRFVLRWMMDKDQQVQNMELSCAKLVLRLRKHGLNAHYVVHGPKHWWDSPAADILVVADTDEDWAKFRELWRDGRIYLTTDNRWARRLLPMWLVREMVKQQFKFRLVRSDQLPPEAKTLPTDTEEADRQVKEAYRQWLSRAEWWIVAGLAICGFYIGLLTGSPAIAMLSMLATAVLAKLVLRWVKGKQKA